MDDMSHISVRDYVDGDEEGIVSLLDASFDGF